MQPDIDCDIIPGAPLVFVFDDQPALVHRMSRVSIADPAKGLGLQVGWFLGHRGMPLTEVLPPILRRIVAEAKPPRVLFAGGGSGGFAALHYARHFPDSVAVVWNPDVNILLCPGMVEYAKAAWGLDDPLELAHSNVADLYRTPGPKVLYLQDMDDASQKLHASAFREATGGRQDIVVYGGMWGGDPPKPFLRTLLRRVATEEWGRVYKTAWRVEFATA